MECKKCGMVEMRMQRVESRKMHFICPKCKEESIIDIEEVEKASKKSEKEN